MGCGGTKVAPTQPYPCCAPEPVAQPPLLRLPADVWIHIADLEGSRTPSYLCRSLWTVLQHRRLTCHANGPGGLSKLLDLGLKTQSLVVRCGKVTPVVAGMPMLQTLCIVPSLTDLSLHLAGNTLSDSHVRV